MSSTTFERSEGHVASGPSALPLVVAGLMGVQAALGLILRAQYRDVEWIRETWFGNDWVTLLVAAPVLVLAGRFAAQGSSRGHVVTLGLLAYAVYNYAYYLFGATLNAFFPLYVALCLLSALTLLMSIGAIDRKVPPVTARRGLTQVAGAYFLCVGTGLAAVWLVMWAEVVFLGHALPIEAEAFQLVAALDLTLMVPLLLVSGVLLWFRRSRGHWIGAAAGIQASMYLTVLAVNSGLAVRSGRVEPPGEFPVWTTIAALTAAATLLLIREIPRNDIANGRAASHPCNIPDATAKNFAARAASAR